MRLKQPLFSGSWELSLSLSSQGLKRPEHEADRSFPSTTFRAGRSSYSFIVTAGRVISCKIVVCCATLETPEKRFLLPLTQHPFQISGWLKFLVPNPEKIACHCTSTGNTQQRICLDKRVSLEFYYNKGHFFLSLSLMRMKDNRLAVSVG